MNKFKSEKARLLTRVNDIRDEIEKVEDELEQLSDERGRILSDFNGSGDTLSVDNAISATEKRLTALNERLALAEADYIEQLRELLPDVEKERARCVAKKTDEYRAAVQQLQRRKLEHLEECRRIATIEAEIEEINREANACRSEGGESPIRYSQPIDYLVFDKSAAHHGTEKASRDVYGIPAFLVENLVRRGELPAWAKEVE